MYFLRSRHENKFSLPGMKMCYNANTRLTQRSFCNWCYEPDEKSDLDVCRHRRLLPPSGEHVDQILIFGHPRKPGIAIWRH